MKKTKQAFTLIELLVVVLIIGILTTVAVSQYKKAVIKAQVTEIQILATQLLKAQKLFYLANGRYATNFDELDFTYPGTSYIREDTSKSAQLVIKNKWDVGMWHGNHFWITPRSPNHIPASFNVWWKTNDKNTPAGRVVCASYLTDDWEPFCQKVTGKTGPDSGTTYKLLQIENY